MTRSTVENFFMFPLLCALGLSLCWSAAQSKWGDSSKFSEIESEFSRVQPPSSAERQGNIRRVEAFALQLVLADYATGMRTKDLESYYDGVLKKNGWRTRSASFSADHHFSLYCKGELDAILDKGSIPGRYFFSVRRQQEPSLRSGCPQ